MVFAALYDKAVAGSRFAGPVEHVRRSEDPIVSRHNAKGQTRWSRPEWSLTSPVVTPVGFTVSYPVPPRCQIAIVSASMVSASGTGRPSATRPSRWKGMASRMSCSTSARVSPATPRPGNAGTYAPRLVAPLDNDGPGCHGLTTLQSGLLEDAGKRTWRDLGTEVA